MTVTTEAFTLEAAAAMLAKPASRDARGARELLFIPALPVASPLGASRLCKIATGCDSAPPQRVTEIPTSTSGGTSPATARGRGRLAVSSPESFPPVAASLRRRAVIGPSASCAEQLGEGDASSTELTGSVSETGVSPLEHAALAHTPVMAMAAAGMPRRQARDTRRAATAGALRTASVVRPPPRPTSKTAT